MRLFCLMLVLLYLNAGEFEENLELRNDFEEDLKEKSKQNLEKEYFNIFGTTMLKSNPDSNNLSLENSSSIFEGKSNSLMFQKQSILGENSQEYEGALLYRYNKNDFNLGLSSTMSMSAARANLGGEFEYRDFFRAYTRYAQDEADYLEQNWGFAFLNFNFDLSKDYQGQNYKFIYKPYGNAFRINFTHRNFNENFDSNSILFGFDFNFREDFSKQFFRKDFQNIYDFLK